MFGYIIINKAEMKFKEFDLYHAYYCGICRDLKRRYGAAGQISLSYDMTFLAMLLTGLYEPETREGTCKCLVHPFESHATRNNIFTEYAADMNALFAYYKCQDDWQDEKKLRGLLYGRVLEGRTEGLRKSYREKWGRLGKLMQAFNQAERDPGADIDTLAGLFGQVMAEIVAVRQDEWEENLRRLGFFLGKFIYLMDAYEDIEEDLKKGTPNPLKERYACPGFEEECRKMWKSSAIFCIPGSGAVMGPSGRSAKKSRMRDRGKRNGMPARITGSNRGRGIIRDDSSRENGTGSNRGRGIVKRQQRQKMG